MNSYITHENIGGYLRSLAIQGRRHRKPRRLTRGWIWDASETNSVKMMKHKDESVFMGASDVSDYITTQVLVQRNEAGLSSCHKRLAIVIDRDKWILEVDTSGLRHIQFNDERGIVIEDATWSFFKYTIASRTVEIDFHGDYDFVE